VAVDSCVIATFHCLLLHGLPGKHTRAGGAGRGTALEDCYIHGEQAGVDTRQLIRYINHSKTNTLQTFVQSQGKHLSGVLYAC
jgi:hypothetical protein